MLVFLIIFVTGHFSVTKKCEITKDDYIKTDNGLLDITTIKLIKILSYEEINNKIAELI